MISKTIGDALAEIELGGKDVRTACTELAKEILKEGNARCPQEVHGLSRYFSGMTMGQVLGQHACSEYIFF